MKEAPTTPPIRSSEIVPYCSRGRIRDRLEGGSMGPVQDGMKLQEPLYEGEHTLILTSVGDSTPPLLTEVPQNISVEYLVQYFVDVNATDETSFDRFFINDTKRY